MLKLKWKRSVVVHRPPEEVFDDVLRRLIDQGQVPGATSMEVSEGPIGVGTTVRWTIPHEGLVIYDHLIITEFEPARRISTRGTRTYLLPPGSTSTHKYANLETAATTIFEPEPGGTRMTSSIQLWHSGVNTLWHPVLLLATGNTYKKLLHKRVDDMLDRLEGPSLARKVAACIRQVWSGWIVFALCLAMLLLVHATQEQLGISEPWLQVLRVIIGLMVVGALLGGYFMAIVRTSRQ